jgi:HYDIN/CFA65/VesB-like, Ig-like domain
MHGSPRLAIGLRQVTHLLLAAALAAGSTAALTTAAHADSNAVAAKKKKKKKCKKGFVRKKGKCKKRKSPAITITIPPTGTAPGVIPPGPPAVLSITPTSHDFGNVPIGTASAPQTFVVTNSGGQSGVVTYTTSGDEEFKVSNDLCTERVLPTGGTCSLDVRFIPPGPPAPGLGPHEATLAVEAPGTSASASLSGFGTLF